MKILYLSKALVVGAYQTKLESLAATGVGVVAAVPPSWKDERGELMLERSHTRGYSLHVLPLFFNGSFHTHFYPTLSYWLDKIRPDILHIDEEPYNFATFHAAWLARRRGIPFLFFTWQNIHRTYPPPFRWMEQWIYRHTAHAIAGNRDAEQVLRRKGYRGPSMVIPQFGVDFRLFDMATRPADQPITIGYAGRFVAEKGLSLLIEAVSTLPTTKPWQLHLRGSGPLEKSLRQQIAARGLTERVSILPPLPSTEMRRFYHESDILVLPSLSRPNWKEQFGRVLIEAMASGTVVVGSDSGEIPHVIGDAGLIVPEGDRTALQSALRLLLADEPLRRRLAQAGRQRVSTHFTQEVIAQQTRAVYRAILERQPKAKKGIEN